LAWCLAEQGQFSEAIQYGLDAVQDAEVCDLAYALVQAWSTLNHVHILRGDFARSVDLSERALAIAQARAVTLLLPFQRWFVGHAWARSGRIAEGTSLIREALAELEALELWRWTPLATIHLGQVCLLGGLIDEARGHAARAVGLACELGQGIHEVYALHLLGETLASTEALEAEKAFRAALALAKTLGLRPLVAHCHLGLGKLYGQAQARQQAHEHVSVATTMYREMGMGFWQDQAEVELANVRTRCRRPLVGRRRIRGRSSEQPE